MVETDKLKGCKVILHDEKSGKTLAETVVLDFDRQRQVITVNTSRYSLADAARLSLLILSERTIVECMGTARRQDSRGQREIALFHVAEKESRGSTRYALQAPARIESVLLANRIIPLDEPLEVTVLDISASGIRIQTDRSELFRGCCFQLRLKIAESDTVVETTVVRVQEGKNGVKSFGCRFIALESGADAILKK